jgi:hypothetical protein
MKARIETAPPLIAWALLSFHKQSLTSQSNNEIALRVMVIVPLRAHWGGQCLWSRALDRRET